MGLLRVVERCMILLNFKKQNQVSSQGYAENIRIKKLLEDYEIEFGEGLCSFNLTNSPLCNSGRNKLKYKLTSSVITSKKLALN